MKKIIGLLFWALGVAGVLAEDTNEVAIYKLLGERGQEIKAHIAAYDNTTNLDEIGTAWWKSRTLQSTNLAMWDAKLHLDVELLSRCLAGVNKTFDETKAKVYMNSRVPPLDPEARKKYDQWVAENERVRLRFRRNRMLKTWGEDCRRHLESSLEWFVGRGDFDGLGAITNAIALKIKDAPTRDKLLQRAQELSKKRAEEQGWGRTPGPPK